MGDTQTWQGPDFGPYSDIVRQLPSSTQRGLLIARRPSLTFSEHEAQTFHRAEFHNRHLPIRPSGTRDGFDLDLDLPHFSRQEISSPPGHGPLGTVTNRLMENIALHFTKGNPVEVDSLADAEEEFPELPIDYYSVQRGFKVDCVREKWYLREDDMF